METRFTIWKEYSPVFEKHRYLVYDDGVHINGFDTEAEALTYVKDVEFINPRKDQDVNNYVGYRVIRYFSFNFLTYRFRTEIRRTKAYSSLVYWDLDEIFDTQADAIERCMDLTANENSACKSDHEPEQIYPVCHE